MGKPKKKTRNPGVGVDFKRVKHKVGKKLPRARNETDTDFKSRSINLPNQAVREDRSNVAVNYQNLTLKELLNQTSHHNDKSRKHSLAGLADLFGRHPEQLHLHAAQVLATLSERIVDGDSSVRTALRELLNNTVLPLLGPDALRPFMPVVMAHVCGAMTHLSLDVRTDALLFLDVMMDHAPQLIAGGFLAPCLAHFCDLFSAAHRGRSLRAQSLAALTKLLTALTSFLRRAFPEAGDPASNVHAAPRGGDGGADTEMGASVRDGNAGAAGAAAGPGPGSVRQQLRAAAAGTAASLAARPGVPLGADRARRPARSAGDLLRQLDELFRSAAAATRAGRRPRGKAGGSGGADAVSADKNRHKKGRGSISTTETAATAAGGKGVAAAAAALAAVTAPAAATAAGMDLSAPSGSTAAGLLGASTAMAAALAAASDARASALRLVTLLMDCWLECDPAQLATSPELEQVNALAMIATACNCLIERLLLPRHQAVGGVDGRPGFQTEPEQQQPGSQGPQSAEQQWLALVQQLHDAAARRVAANFPTVLPPVKPPAAVVEALVRLNLQSAELLGRFLPLLSSHNKSQRTVRQQQQAAAPEDVEPLPLPWVPSLVSYYVGALEQGLLLPPAAGKLSDTSDVAAQGGMSAASTDTVLLAVAAVLQHLDDAAAAQLMAAVALFAARQSPRSGARLACLRMQHSLLRAAVAGRLFLADGVVAGWLEPLPKLLWEAGGSSPEVSAAALALVMDAARFLVPGSSMYEFLSSTLQPQLAPLFTVHLPPKASKAALAKAAGTPGKPAGGEGGAEVMVLLPGAVSKLPQSVASVAVDLIYHTGPLGATLLKALAATISSAMLPIPLALRLLDVALARLRDAPDPALAASWLLTLLFGPQHGQRVLSPDGTDLTPTWSRQRALVDAAVMGLGQLGGATPLLLVLGPQLAALPLTQPATAGARGARIQRYSLLRLCGTALGEAGGQKLPEVLAATLPAAAALCGVEAGAAAGLNAAESEALPYRSTFGPVVQLLTERPVLATAVVRHLAALLMEAAVPLAATGPPGATSSSPAVGQVPVHTVALAALQLAQALVKLQAVRSVVVASAVEREALVAAVQDLSQAVRQLPVAAVGAPGSDQAASCGLESQRLTQIVADLFGSRAGT